MRTALHHFVADELSGQAPQGVEPLAQALRARHRGSLRAVLLYGSCLRRQSSAGVVDLWALLDDDSPDLSRADRWLPPHVSPLVVELSAEPLHAKVAAIRMSDFTDGAAGRHWRPQVWARFCQPTRLLWARDGETRTQVEEAVAECLRTAVQQGLALLPDASGHQCFASEELWHALLADTYAAELRTERPDAVRDLYASASGRHDGALELALEALAAEARLSFVRNQRQLEVRQPTVALSQARRRRRSGRAIARLAHALYLLKSTLTFDDWLPYALGKLERQTGTKLEASERQRRQPLLFAWPLVWRVLRSRDLR